MMEQGGPGFDGGRGLGGDDADKEPEAPIQPWQRGKSPTQVGPVAVGTAPPPKATSVAPRLGTALTRDLLSQVSHSKLIQDYESAETALQASPRNKEYQQRMTAVRAELVRRLPKIIEHVAFGDPSIDFDERVQNPELVVEWLQINASLLYRLSGTYLPVPMANRWAKKLNNEGKAAMAIGIWDAYCEWCRTQGYSYDEVGATRSFAQY